jgi:hypothetical protein
MAVEAVQQLYDAAFELGFAGMAKAIVKAVLQSAEAVRAVCGERFVHGMLAAIRHVRVSEGGDLMFWAQEPGLQSLDTGSCVQVLEALLQLCGEPHELESAELPFQLLDLLQAVFKVPACQDMTSHDVTHVIKACIGPPRVSCEKCESFMADVVTHIACGSLPELAWVFWGTIRVMMTAGVTSRESCWPCLLPPHCQQLLRLVLGSC